MRSRHSLGHGFDLLLHYIYKMTERPVVLLNAIFCFSYRKDKLKTSNISNEHFLGVVQAEE